MEGKGPEERFEIAAEIGRGGRASVVAAHDLLLGRDVVLKRALSPADEPILREEARRLARITSPRVVRLLDVLLGPPFALVLERLRGQSLRDLLHTRGRLPVDDAVRVVGDVLEALRDVHAAGLVHGDIKPENLWWHGSSEPLRLLDLGALGDATAIYAAPETGSGPPAPCVDVYAAGVVAFEILCGRPPFDASDPVELAARKQRLTPPTASSAGATVPEPVEAWLRRALAPQPQDRFADASAALDAWRSATVAVGGVRRRSTHAPILHPEAWERALQVLEATARGGAATLALAGERGLGKSALVARWCERARGLGMSCLHVRMSPSLRRDSFAAWSAARRATFSGGLFPAARPVRGARAEMAEQERMVRALRRAARPLAIAVDRIETCDGPTRRLVLRLLEETASLRLGLLVTLDEGARGRAARWTRDVLAAHGVEMLRLGVPAAADWRAWLADALGTASPSDALIEHVRVRSGGNPRLALDLIDDLRMRGALQRSGDGWIFRPEVAGTGPPPGACGLLEGALRGLSPQDRELLEVAAIHGERCDPAVVAHRFAISPAEITERLHRLAEEQRVLERDGATYRFRVPLVADMLRAGLSPERRRQEHGAAAAALEALASTDSAALGEHLYRAGERARALPHLQRAGSEALSHRDAATALRCLDLACTAADALLVDEAGARLRADLGVRRAAALQELAAWGAAGDELQTTLVTARAWGQDDLVLRALVLLGEIEYAQGRFDEAIEPWTEAQEAATRHGADGLVHEIHLKIGNVHFERGDLPRAAAEYEQALEWATRVGEVDLEARAAHNVALVESIQGRKERAVDFFNRSLERFRSLGREDAVARIDLNIGQIYLELGNWAEARNFFLRSMEESERSGQTTILAAACLDGAEASLRLGAPEEAAAAIDRALAIGRERGDEVGVANAYRLQASLAAARGDIASAEARLLESIDILQRLGQALQLGLCWKDLGAVRLQDGRTAAAAAALDEARRLFASLDAAQHAAEVEALSVRVREVAACRS